MADLKLMALIAACGVIISMSIKVLLLVLKNLKGSGNIVNLMYLESASKTWDAFSARLFSKKPFAGHQLILGKTLKEKFRDMMKDCEKKHGLNEGSAGYETHPDITRYYSLLLKMLKEIEKKRILLQLTAPLVL